MARFDVYANPDTVERKLIPFFLDVQNDHVKGLQTRVVVPLWKSGLLPTPVENLNPQFDVAGQRVVMDTPAIGAAPITALRRAVENLASQQLSIQDALDTLFGSY
ncbi:MAG TPA: CcdB family protein [Burkholderiaceae bacterium]|nr:CcdB family protein [Burkholderiaceae bacterium]